MKQNLTDGQVLSFSDEQLIKLHNFLCKTDRGSIITVNGSDIGFSGGKSKSVDISSYRKIGVFTTVGKMIEFLMNNEGFDIELQRMSDGTDVWVISYWKGYDEGIPIGGCSISEELCDALWKAIKEVL